MSRISLRLPDSLHKAVKELAEQDSISANQFIALAVAEKVSAMMTLDWIERRARRAPSPERFKGLLAQAGDSEPLDEDR